MSKAQNSGKRAGSWGVLILLLLGAPACGAGEGQLRPWQDYRTIMWVGDAALKQPGKFPLFLERLREMGINTAMVFGDGDPGPLVSNRFPYYVENLVNRGLCLKFRSNVQDWDKFVTQWTRDGRPETALVRDHCLDDPEWRDWARKEASGIVRKNRGNQPLAYDLRDELSTTISANPFDYDFNPITLARFRIWLKEHHGTVEALNAAWETGFKSWEEVKPFTTDQIKNRMASGQAQPRGQPDWQQLQALKFDPLTARDSTTRWNFSPWADFRSYMDSSLSGVLDELRQSIRELDPQTPVGIEGTQMPHAFGGYDLWRLSQAVDWIEPYDIGNAREIFGSFMPGKPILTTVFEKETREARRRLWHLLLEGDRGCIVWWSEDCIDWKSEDYRLTPKGLALAPVLREMTSPLARIILRAKPEFDPIYIHYSQASIQVDWLLESTVDGSSWLRRFSSYESGQNQLAKVRNGWLKALQDVGYSPRFISSAQLEAGMLTQAGPAVLVMPSSWALSEVEAGQIRALSTVARSGEPRGVFWNGAPGCFDEHGRVLTGRLAAPVLPPGATGIRSVFAAGGGAVHSGLDADVAGYPALRLGAAVDGAGALPRWMQERLSALERVFVLPIEARARVHRYRVGRGLIVAVERNADYQMSEELKRAGGNEVLEKPVELTGALAKPRHVYDLRRQKYLGLLDRIPFTLDPWQPSLFALLDEHVPEEEVLAKLSAE